MVKFALHWMIGLLLVPAIAAARAGQTPQAKPDPPASAGVYYKGDPGEWTKLIRATVYDAKTHGMERFLETDGYSKLNTTAAFDGAQSPFQIAERKPKFHIRGTGSPKDALIVLLTRKSDRREVRFSSAEIASDNRGGFLPGAIRRVQVVVLAGDLFTIVPEESLKPGEYLIVFGEPNTGFDFRIVPSRK